MFSKFVHCPFVAGENVSKSEAGVKKKNDQFRIVGTERCENFREIQSHIQISAVVLKNPLFEKDGASECWFIRILLKVGLQFDKIFIIIWFLLGFQKLLYGNFERKIFLWSDKLLLPL